MNPRILLFFILFFVGFSNQNSAASVLQETVFVSILPQRFFLQQISGDLLDIEVMVQPGASPATYEPRPSQMKKLATCSAYFAIGVPFENVWLEKISRVNPAMPVIHIDEGISKVAMKSHHHEGEHHSADKHREDEAARHGHTGLDPHIWLSPTLVKKQADAMYKGLSGLFPEKEEYFRINHQQFLEDIDRLHSELQDMLKDIRGKQFMVFHPSWGYFAREYGLEQVAIEIEGKSPKPAQLQKLIEHGRETGIKVIFAQAQFSTKNASIIARELGGEVVIVDPLAEDWFNNLRETAQKLRFAVQ